MTISSDARRLAAALEAAGVSGSDEDAQSIQTRLDRFGALRTVSDLNETYEVLLQLGPYILRSEMEHGYWSNDFGFVLNRDAATGYPASVLKDEDMLRQVRVLAPDVTFAAYNDATDFDAQLLPELDSFSH